MTSALMKRESSFKPTTNRTALALAVAAFLAAIALSFAAPAAAHAQESSAEGALKAEAFSLAATSQEDQGAEQSDAVQGRTIEDGVYELRIAKKTAYALDVNGASLANGARVQLYKRNSTLAQRWSFKLESDGYYSVVSVASGKALGVKGNSTKEGAAVQQRTAKKSPFQRWAVTPGKSGTYYLVNKATGLALSVSGKAKNSVPARMQPASGGTSQRFVFKRVNALPAGAHVIYSALAPEDQAIDVGGCSTRSGVQLQTYEANGTIAQRMYLRRVSQDTYGLQAVCSGLYLTSESGKVVQRKRTGKEAQQWRAQVEPGGIAFVNVATGKRLAVSGGAAENGAKLRTAKTASKASRFILEPANLIPNGTYVIENKAKGMVVDIDGSSVSTGANALVYTANYGGNQAFNVKAKGDGVYDIRNAFSKKALDVNEGSRANGANVQQWDPNGTDAQRWKITLDADGGLKLKNVASRNVLTASGKGGQGANVVSRADKGSKTQRWTLSPAYYELDKPLRRAAVKAENLSSSTPYLIMVDVTNNRTVVFKGSKGNWRVWKNWVVSTGAPSMPTVLGDYTIAMRGYSFGSGYTCYYWTQFYGDFLFHSILYDEGTFNVQDGRLGYSISHGCVRMNINDAKWIYDNIPSGTHVRTYK